MECKPKEIAEILLDLKAVKLRPQDPFVWASGIRSPIYCDNRITLSHPEERNFISRSLIELVDQVENVDVVAGVATAGIPYASIIAHMLEKPLIYVRSASKGHGRQNVIEGEYKPGQKILLIEDLISTGGSSLEAAEHLRQANLEVLQVIAIFTYRLPEAEKAFSQANLPYKTLCDYPALIDQAVEMGYVQEKDLQILKDWNQSPKTWKNE